MRIQPVVLSNFKDRNFVNSKTNPINYNGYNGINNNSADSVSFQGKIDIKKSLKEFKLRFTEFVLRPPNPIVSALKGKRDKDGVVLYKKTIAELKLDSLHKKIEENLFEEKTPDILNKILKNMVKLQREAQIVKKV